MSVVVVYDGAICRETAVVIEAALLPHEQAAQGRGAIHAVRRAPGLEVVDADLLGRVHAPSRFGEDRRNVAARARAFACEEHLAALGCCVVVGVFLWTRG